MENGLEGDQSGPDQQLGRERSEQVGGRFQKQNPGEGYMLR